MVLILLNGTIYNGELAENDSRVGMLVHKNAITNVHKELNIVI